MSTINSEFLREARSSQLSLFDMLPTQTAVENVYYQQVHPITQLTGSTVIEFNITSNTGMHYIDLAKSFMSLKMRIVHSHGKPLLPEEYVGPVILVLQSL